MVKGDIIELKNRSRRNPDKLELIRIDGDLYIFKVIPDSSLENHWRIIAGDNKQLQFIEPFAIDPPDGPYISVGDPTIIPGFTLIKIYTINGFTLIFKKDE